MKIENLILFLLLIFVPCFSFGQGKVNPNYNHVSGYVRKDGTYVQGHYRTNPNSTNRDNYSTLGNTNPWTGQEGWVLPDNKSSNSYGTSSWNLPTTYTAQPSNLNYFPQTSSGINWDYNKNLDFPAPKIETTNITSYSPDYFENYSYPSVPRNVYSYKSGVKTIYYKDGKEVFSVLATSKTKFKKQLTYHFYDPELDKVLTAQGEAFGQLLDGKYRMILENGTTLFESTFKQGVYDGLHIEYDNNGKEKLKIIYSEGEIINYRGFNDANELVEWEGTPFKFNSRRTFKKNGIVRSREEYKSETHYKIFTYNELNGRLLNEFNYERDVPNGVFKFYHSDGRTPSRTGTILNQELHGEIKDFAENGTLVGLTTFSNGKKNGRYEIYFPDGKLSERGTFKNDLLDGTIEVFGIDDDIIEKTQYISGKRNGVYEKRKGTEIRIRGHFIRDEPNGKWDYFIKNDESQAPFIATYYNYENGVKNGKFKEIRNDSILIGAYKDGNIDGIIKIYRPISLWLLGLIPQDVEESEVIAEGNMSAGKKSGNWTFFDVTHSVITEGQFFDDKMHGEWRYYYPKYVDINGSPIEYSGKLYLIENYLNGLQNGKTERFSFLEKTPIMCDTSIGTVNPLDTCFKMNWIKRHDLIYFKNNSYHGPVELIDSLGILVKGNYINGKKADLWLYRQEPSVVLTGYYFEDLQNGIWKTIVNGNKVMDEKTFKNGKKEGVSIDYDYFGNKLNQALYKDGQIQFVAKFDTISHQLQAEFREIKYTGKECSYIHTFSRHDTVFSYHVVMTSLFSNSETDQNFFLLDVDNLQNIPDGQFSQTNTNGKTLILGNYVKGIKVGNWDYYDHKQGIKRTITYENDKRKSDYFTTISTQKPFSGTFQTFSSVGNIRAKIKVKKGLRHGKTIVYDKNGEVEKIKKYKKGILVQGVED